MWNDDERVVVIVLLKRERKGREREKERLVLGWEKYGSDGEEL